MNISLSSEQKPLLGRVILVTGASRGIGRAAACALASAGAELIITGRTTGALEELDDDIKSSGSTASIVEMDQTDADAIPRLASAISMRWGRLDGFVANAGQLGQMAPMPHIDADVFERTMEVNLTSVWRQIAAFDALLRKSDSGRAVLMTSGAAIGARAYWGAYAVSKAGLEAMGRAWAAESEQTNLNINLLDPGAVATAMRAAAYPGEDSSTLPSPQMLGPAFIYLMSAECTHHGHRLNARDFFDD